MTLLGEHNPKLYKKQASLTKICLHNFEDTSFGIRLIWIQMLIASFMCPPTHSFMHACMHSYYKYLESAYSMLWLVLDPVNKTHLLVLIHCITLEETDQTCMEIHHEMSVCDSIQIHSTGSLWCPCIETVPSSHVLIHLSTPLSNISLGHLDEARHY